MSQHGIFDSRAFGGAGGGGRVLLSYCSSDAHMGNASAFGRDFRGAEIVSALLHDLVHLHGLGGAAQGTTLVFGGGSAGARGAMVHLDRVQGRVDGLLRGGGNGVGGGGGVRVLGWLDSALWLDLPPMAGSGSIGATDETRAVHAYARVDTGVCASVYAGGEAWRCLFGEYRLPLLRVPYVAVASQHDAYQLDRSLAPHAERTAAGRAYLAHFANRTVEVAWQLAASPGRLVYSSRCHRHARSASWDFGAAGCMAESMEQALLQLLAGAAAPGARWDTLVDRGVCAADQLRCACCDRPAQLGARLGALLGLLTALVAAAAWWRWGRIRGALPRKRTRRLQLQGRPFIRHDSSQTALDALGEPALPAPPAGLGAAPAHREANKPLDVGCAVILECDE